MDKKLLFLKWILLIWIPFLALSGCAKHPDKKVVIQEFSQMIAKKELELASCKAKTVVKEDEIYENGAKKKSFYRMGKRKVLITMVTNTTAGLRLNDFKAETDIIVDPVNKEHVTIRLPEPVILSFDAPIDSLEEEYSISTGTRAKITLDEKMNIVQDGINDFMESADNLGILNRARENAVSAFESMFKRMGYTEIDVTFYSNAADSSSTQSISAITSAIKNKLSQ